MIPTVKTHGLEGARQLAEWIVSSGTEHEAARDEYIKHPRTDYVAHHGEIADVLDSEHPDSEYEPDEEHGRWVVRCRQHKTQAVYARTLQDAFPLSDDPSWCKKHGKTAADLPRFHVGQHVRVTLKDGEVIEGKILAVFWTVRPRQIRIDRGGFSAVKDIDLDDIADVEILRESALRPEPPERPRPPELNDPSYNEDDSRWLWGDCAAYAVGMRELKPHTSVGYVQGDINNGKPGIAHVFVHDKTHVYDATGKTPRKEFEQKAHPYKVKYNVPDERVIKDVQNGELNPMYDEDIDEAKAHWMKHYA
jgi:hypothetical protein